MDGNASVESIEIERSGVSVPPRMWTQLAAGAPPARCGGATLLLTMPETVLRGLAGQSFFCKSPLSVINFSVSRRRISGMSLS
jgi:hypothetical protein